MTDSLIVDTTRRIFQDLGDPQTVNNAADDNWQAPLWTALEEAGLTRTWVPDELGGAGASVADGFDVLKVAGNFAAAVPLAETMIAGRWLALANLAVPDGMVGVLPVRDGEAIAADGQTLTGTSRDVPFADTVARFAVIAERDGAPHVALVGRDQCQLRPGRMMKGDPKHIVVLDGATAEAIAPLPTALPDDAAALTGAAVRAVQMAGALEAVLDIAAGYAQERVAFGRPISKFQAVQHSLAQLAGESAAATTSAGAAAQALAAGDAVDDSVRVAVAAAKVRVGEAAGAGAAIGHQVLGAIGFTEEHILHRYTNRLWSWRDDFGGEAIWAVRLGRMFAGQGGDALWPAITTIG